MLKALLYCCLLAGLAAGQGVSATGTGEMTFNVDVGLGPLAQPQCGGDPAQPGVWNRFGIDQEGRMELVDTRGRATSVVLQSENVGTWVSCNTEQPGGDPALLGDGAQTSEGAQVWILSGMQPGRYLLTVYARADCTSDTTEISVMGDDIDGSCLGRAQHAQDNWGSSFVLSASQGRLIVVLTPSSPQSEVRLSGLQLQPVGQGPVALLSAGSQLVALRSGGEAPLSAPSCAVLQVRGGEGLVLSGGPVGVDFNVLQPARAPIQTYLSPAGWFPETASPHAAMQWAGVQFWWQLDGRQGAPSDTTWLWRD